MSDPDRPTGPTSMQPAPPVSATPAIVGLLGLAGAVAALLALPHVEWPTNLKTLAVVALTAAPMIAAAAWTSPGPPDGLAQDVANPFSLSRLLRKLIGFWATLAVLYAAYAQFPEYAEILYDPAWRTAWTCAPWLALVSPVYIAWVDRRQIEPGDAYAQLGGMLTGSAWPADWEPLAQHARGWLVKGFFLPLMFVYLVGSLDAWWRIDPVGPLMRPTEFYESSYAFLYLLDLLFAVVGYAFALRLIDTHIRSAEPTLLGWLACLVCYQPFWSVMDRSYLSYERDSVTWRSLSEGWPALHAVWGAAILVCVFVYAWATVAFGLRFSNLTHRGIITNGPYRWIKHPAYVSKNLSFWLVSAPFLSTQGPWPATVQSAALLMVNGIYAARALTEERHLARDPRYRAYQEFIRQHGLFAAMMRLASRRRRAVRL